MTCIIKGSSIVTLYPQWIDFEEATALFKSLREEIPWRHDAIKIAGKEILQPRLTFACGDSSVKEHRYSGISVPVIPWTSELLSPIRDYCKRINDLIEGDFNACLLNYYRDGQDSIGHHSDREGTDLIKKVATISLGGTRDFLLKHKTEKTLIKQPLSNGDLVLMLGRTQEEYTHSIPTRAKQNEPRISLTYRHL